MPRNASGIYTLPPSNPVIPFTVITSDWANTTMADVAAALTGSIAANGTTTIAADIPMNGFKFTGVSWATQPNQFAVSQQVQFGELNKITSVTYSSGSNTYSGNASFGMGNTVAMTDKTPAIMTTVATNTASNPLLSLNGGTAYPIRNPDNTVVAANKFVAGMPISLTWNQAALAWIMVGSTGASILTIDSADPQVLSTSYPVPGASLLTPLTNVANGGVKLTGATKIPVGLLPADGFTMLGLWNAAPGANPANGTASGQYYVVTNGGNLTLFVATGPGGGNYAASSVPVVSGDRLLWNQTAPEPTGWYRVQNAGSVTAASVSIVPTPTAPAATTVQAWANQVDSAAGFATLDGNRIFTNIHANNLIQSPNFGRYR